MNVLQNMNKYLVVLIVVLASFTANACDLCSCTTSGGNGSFGNLGMSNFIGIRYIHQSYKSQNGIFANSPESEEQFNTYQLWGFVPLSETFYVSAVIPYQDLSRNFQNQNEDINGFGDITVMGWYKWKIQKKSEEETITDKIDSGHSITIGVGVKSPTGEFEQRLTNRINPGFQVGTGSWDFITSALHTFEKNNVGISTNVSYYIKSENKNNYKFGNQFSFNTNVYYKLNTSKMDISPFVGFSGDFYESIQQYGEKLPETDGTIYNATLGTECNLRKVQVGGKFTFPVSQDLFGGNVTSQNSFSVYLNYVL